MKEILTEFDLLQEAMKKIDMNEVAMPIHNGKIVENKESYCKMQQILGAPEMIKSHAFILNLDPEQLEEDEIERVDKLWNLGVNRGFITPDGDEKTDNEIVAKDAPTIEPPPEQKAPETAFSYKTQKVDIPCWTILYSACNKNGDIKTGECFSNATNSRAAKADCYAKLERCGYTNISILAIEAGDPDNCDCSGNSSQKTLLAEMPPENDEASDAKMIPDDEFMKMTDEAEESDVDEADTSFEEPKSAHASGTQEKISYTDDGEEEEVAGPTDAEKDSEGADYKTLYSEFLTAADDYQQIVDLQGENSMAAKNAFKEVQGAYEDCYAAVTSMADEKELLSQVNAYGFKLAADNCTILEGEEELVDESGNPYLAGMKTADLNGQMKVSMKGSSKPSKAKLEEDDEDSNSDSDSDSSDDSEKDSDSDDGDNSSNEESEETSDDSSEDDDDESSDENSEDDSDEDDSDSDSDEEDSDSDTEESDEEEPGESDEDSDDSEDDEEDEDSDDEEDEDDEDNEDSDDDSEDKEETKELSDEEKAQYKSDYKKTFKDVMLKCKFEDKCFDDLSIAEKVKFFTKLQKAWKKNEPKDFMSDKEIEQLNKVAAKK